MATKRTRRNEEDPVKGKRKKETKTEEDDDDAPLVIKCKTTFKKRLVLRALEKEEERDSDDDNSEDPIIKYFVKYCVDTGIVSVGGVEVIVDEIQKCLRCSKCNFANKSKWEGDKKTEAELRLMMLGIKNHIIGQHLGGFPCLDCKPVQVIHKSLSSHQRHVMENHNEYRKKADEIVKEDTVKISDNILDGDKVWPNGAKRIEKRWKCSFPNCGQQFFQLIRWIRHGKDVHGVTFQAPEDALKASRRRYKLGKEDEINNSASNDDDTE